MCLYGRPQINRKYTKNKKNGGLVPPIEDSRTEYIIAKCGNCIECRKEKARDWQIRMLEDVRKHKNGKFITLTFSTESIKEIIKTTIVKKNKVLGEKVEIIIDQLEGYEKDNAIATKAIRRFTERWRKEFKEPIRHWLVTELGHNGTENIHLHGIIWTDKDIDTIKRIWKYGFTWPRNNKEAEGLRNKGKYYVNEQTVNYVIKYVSKIDKDHEGYKSKVLTSAGIGKCYLETQNIKLNEYNGRETNEYYITRTGHKVGLPKYWKNKIYSEDEKERLWINKLDQPYRYVMGEKVSIINGTEDHIKAIEYYRKINKKLGYGDDTEWQKARKAAEEREKMINKRLTKKPRRQGS